MLLIYVIVLCAVNVKGFTPKFVKHDISIFVVKTHMLPIAVAVTNMSNPLMEDLSENFKINISVIRDDKIGVLLNKDPVRVVD